MGLLVDGIWHEDWYDTEKSGGRFERFESTFRIGSPPTAGPALVAEAAFGRKRAAIICMWRIPAPGPIAP